MSTPSLPAVCYDLNTISRFFRSVGLAMAFQQHTQQEWVVQRDSSVINALYSVMFWKEPPGVVEIRQSSKARIEATADQLHERFLMAWIRKLAEQGPAEANAYVSHMTGIRDFARAALQQMFQDASQINQMVAGQLKEAITDLARIKLAGTVGVALLGATGAIVLAPAGAMICGGVSLGYSSSCSLIKTWEQGPFAKAVGVGTEGAKAVGSDMLGRAAGATEIKALAQQGKAQQIVQSCEGEIRKYSQRLTQEGLRKAQIAKARGIVGRASTQMAGQQQVVTQATRVVKAASVAKVGVPLLFAAWDIWEGFGDYNETMGQLN